LHIPGIRDHRGNEYDHHDPKFIDYLVHENSYAPHAGPFLLGVLIFMLRLSFARQSNPAVRLSAPEAGQERAITWSKKLLEHGGLGFLEGPMRGGKSQKRGYLHRWT
jgi:hypothetical protein